MGFPRLLHRSGLAALMAWAVAAAGCASINQQSRRAPETPRPQATASINEAKPVAELWRMPDDPERAESALRAVLARARAEGLPVSVVGGRSSQGGQTFIPGGLLIDMRPHHAMTINAKARVMTVAAGARWWEVLDALNRRGLSPEVMPPFNDFTVGGSLSVNSHGSFAGKGPISSAVRSFRLMLADGQVVTCSRQSNSELFRAALGGYGLFGVLLDVDLRLVPNERYRVQRFFTKPAQFAETFEAQVAHAKDAGMAFGRLSVAPRRLLQEAILTVYRRAPGPVSAGGLGESAAEPLKRRYWRDAIGSAGGKEAQWEAEKRADTGLWTDFSSRNELLNESAERYTIGEDDGPTVVQTYFLPRPMLAPFLDQARGLVPAHRADLLEATVRDVRRDADTLLRYADQDMFALTLVFHQPRTSLDERDMEALTRELVSTAVALKGRYYLPYRLTATMSQFVRAYPEAPRFFDLKRRYDPEGRFQNQLYVKYGGAR